LPTSSTSLKIITSTPTALIDVATDMKTLESVNSCPNKTAQEFSSNLSSTSSRDSTIRKNMTAARRQNSQEFSKTEQHDDMYESTKGSEEDINSSGKRKPSANKDSEESHGTKEEADIYSL
jgi:hypothetical protein